MARLFSHWLFPNRLLSARVCRLWLLCSVMLLSGCSTVSGAWHGFWSASSEHSDTGKQDTVKHATPASVIKPSPSTANISVIWRNDVDQRKPASPPGFSLPAVVSGKHGKLVVAGAEDRRVRIYQANGSEAGRIALRNASESGAVELTNGLVVVGDTGGILYGLDISHSKVVWQVQLSAALFGRPVTVDNDFIVQTSNNQIYRFTNKGEKVWSFSGQLGGLGIHLSPSPVVYNNHVYAVFTNGDVIALKAGTGNFVWKRQLVLSNQAAVMSEVKIPTATPLVVPAAQSGRGEDMLVVSVFQGELFFLSLQDGSTLNTRHLSVKATPMLIGKTLFVADAAGALSALDVSNAVTLWKQQLSATELTGLATWQGSIWVTDGQAHVFRLNRDGRVLARTQLDGRIDRAPVVAGNGVLVRNNLGTLYLLR